MKQVNYIFVNETGNQNAVNAIRNSRVSAYKQCVMINAGSRFNIQGSNNRGALIHKLYRLRKHYPEAPILGVSEVDPSNSHTSIRVNPWMNQLRRDMSDYLL